VQRGGAGAVRTWFSILLEVEGGMHNLLKVRFVGRDG